MTGASMAGLQELAEKDQEGAAACQGLLTQRLSAALEILTFGLRY